MLFSLPLVTTALTTNPTIHSSGIIGLVTTRPLHVEGNLIKDSQNNTIYLRGVGSWKFWYDPTGWFQPEGGGWVDGQLEWNEVNVRYHLQTMQEWGFNVFRLHTAADWWLEDQVTVDGFSGSFRQIVKDLITWAADYGIYIMIEHYTPINFKESLQHGVGIPYAPYADSANPSHPYHSVFPDAQAFVDYWQSIANELKGFPNVIFELHNEPHAGWQTNPDAARESYFNTMQKCINAIRSIGATQLIALGWGLALANSDTGWDGGSTDFPPAVDMSYIDATWTDEGTGVLQTGWSDTLGNLIYTAHTYIEYVSWNAEYNALKGEMQDALIEWAANKVPVYIGEFSVNQWNVGDALAWHLLWAENFMKILNEWGIGYIGWNWSVVNGEDSPAWGVISDQGWLIYGPSPWGQKLVDAIAEGGTMEPS